MPNMARFHLFNCKDGTQFKNVKHYHIFSFEYYELNEAKEIFSLTLSQCPFNIDI
jgi:hypothetical protein